MMRSADAALGESVLAPASAAMPAREQIHDVARSALGLPSIRTEQEEAVASVLAGRDTPR